jgi:hypothetical protein
MKIISLKKEKVKRNSSAIDIFTFFLFVVFNSSAHYPLIPLLSYTLLYYHILYTHTIYSYYIYSYCILILYTHAIIYYLYLCHHIIVSHFSFFKHHRQPVTVNSFKFLIFVLNFTFLIFNYSSISFLFKLNRRYLTPRPLSALGECRAGSKICVIRVIRG